MASAPGWWAGSAAAGNVHCRRAMTSVPSRTRGRVCTPSGDSMLGTPAHTSSRASDDGENSRRKRAIAGSTIGSR